MLAIQYMFLVLIKILFIKQLSLFTLLEQVKLADILLGFLAYLQILQISPFQFQEKLYEIVL